MCCMMALINMCLNDLTGEIYHMNTISQKIWRAWRVCRWPITRHPYILELTIVDAPETGTLCE